VYDVKSVLPKEMVDGRLWEGESEKREARLGNKNIYIKNV
jgi:hypothetical protein